MEPYNFWQDFFDSYRSSSDAIKALWLIVPPAFVVAQTWVILHSLRMTAPPDRAEHKIGQQKSRIN